MNTIDLAIIISYLLVTLLVGLYQGRKIRTMKDYAIADRNYTTPVMVATIFATWIGGGSTIGLVEKVAITGFSYLVLFLGEPINKLIMARIFAPKMERFEGLISVGDIMEQCYGKACKIVTGFAGSFLSVGLLGAQISALGFLFHYFFDLSHFWGVIVGFGIVVSYSTVGGIRAVTLTDVIQFGILLVAIPMICNVGLNMIGGYEELFKHVPDHLLQIVPDDKATLRSNIFLFSVISLPWMMPSAIQRLLMSRNANQIKKSFTIAAILDIPLHLTIGIIAMITVVLIPETDASLAMPALINQILPTGLKGIAMIGMVAVIMSTCDSYLNAASVSLVHDTIKPLAPHLSHRSELALAKIITFILGIFSIIIAVKYRTVMDIVFASLNVWGPVILVPLYAGILGCCAPAASFFLGAGAGLSTVLVWKIFDLDKQLGIEGSIPSMAMNSFFFFISHWFYKKKAPFKSGYQKFGCKKKETGFFFLKKAYKDFKQWSFAPFSKLINRLDNDNPPYMLFGIFSLMNYIFPYFMWSYRGSFAISTGLRFIGGVLSFFLLLKDYWPEKVKPYLSHYWFLTLLYCLPFLTTYTLLENQGAYDWIVTASLVLLLLSVLVDWVNFAVILVLGITLGTLFFISLNGVIALDFDRETLLWIFYMYSLSTIIGFVFSRRREQLSEERLRTMKFMGGTIAHELRTPLASIDMNCRLIQKDPTKIDDCLESIQRISKNTQSVIDNLLTKISPRKKLIIETLELNPLIEKTLSLYESKESENIIVHKDLCVEPLYINVDEHLFVHVILNLFKNACESVKRAGKGTVRIRTYIEKDSIYLSVTDTGEGLSSSQQSLLFQEFFSTKKGGAGLGLFFVKNVLTRLDMRIEVSSQKGEFTTITINCGKMKNV
tara:strand:+ start:1406 stop:4078 length:2673 start_codon:yes stop_codon:yes gene_type:complete